MNQQNRRLLLAAGGGPVLLGLLYLGYLQLSVMPGYEAQLDEANAELDRKAAEVRGVLRDLPKLQRWRQLSLPTDVHLAQREYSRYLHDLVRGRLAHMALQPNTPTEVKVGSGPTKQTTYTSLTFNVRGQAAIADLANVLEKFQRTPLVHKIKSLTVQRGEDNSSPLTVQMTVEALIVEGAVASSPNLAGVDQRLLTLDVLAGLRRGPTGIALIPWIVSPRGPAGQEVLIAAGPRNYADLSGRNIFTGALPPPPPPPPPEKVVEKPPPPPPPEEPDDFDIRKVVYLAEISQSAQQSEALLFNRATNQSTRLRVAKGYDSFQVKNESGKRVVVRGQIVRIEPRDVFFETEKEMYVIHIGQTLAEALRQPLGAAEVEELGLKVAESQ